MYWFFFLIVIPGTKCSIMPIMVWPKRGMSILHLVVGGHVSKHLHASQRMHQIGFWMRPLPCRSPILWMSTQKSPMEQLELIHWSSKSSHFHSAAEKAKDFLWKKNMEKSDLFFVGNDFKRSPSTKENINTNPRYIQQSYTFLDISLTFHQHVPVLIPFIQLLVFFQVCSNK